MKPPVPPIRTEDLPALFKQRRLPELEAAARALLAENPDDGILWKALGVALEGQGRTAQALEAKRKSVALMPDDLEANLNLGNALLATGDIQGAINHLVAATRIDGSSVKVWRRLSEAMQAANRIEDAVGCLRNVTQIEPGSVHAHNDLGNLLRDLGQNTEAEECYRKALTLQPRNAPAAANLGSTLKDQAQFIEAELWYRRAMDWLPGIAEMHSNLANLLNDIGQLKDAQQNYRKALTLKPDSLVSHSNLLLSLNYDDTVRPDLLLQEARQYGERAQKLARGPMAARHRGGPGPLRVGLVSGDLRQHPVGHFCESWLAHIDKSRVQLYAYSTVPKADQLTQRIHSRFHQWHWIRSLNDQAAARLIHSHGIDVLVDLAGHTAYNRLGLFAWRPAPVQASWLGYFATTGLPSMDWIIADPPSVPDSDRDQYTERIWYLPETRLCFTPPAEAKEPLPAPYARNGFITFGSFQLLGKLNTTVLGAWARIMQGTPRSRLRLQNSQLNDAAARRQFAAHLRRHGIDPDRVSLVGKVPRADYLAAHGEVDIVLDTFPYPGGAKTCEALWMGVPTVSIEGTRMLSRQGAALLQAAGLPEWVGKDVEGYVAKGLHFAAQPELLINLRSTLRERVRHTPLFDAPRFAGHFMDALERMAASP